ncbi:hypothetical protein Emed_002546 [Eimeria media]
MNHGNQSRVQGAPQGGPQGAPLGPPPLPLLVAAAAAVAAHAIAAAEQLKVAAAAAEQSESACNGKNTSGGPPGGPPPSALGAPQAPSNRGPPVSACKQEEAGSIESLIHNHQSTSDERFKVIVLTHAIDGRHGIRFLTEGIKVYYLPLTCFHDRSTLITFFTTLPLIRTILIREKVDIVHGHQTTSTLAHESIFHARHLGYKDVPAYIPDLSKRPPPPSIHILILSRLSYRKGIDLLVDMIPAVCAKYPNVTFIIGFTLLIFFHFENG